MKLTAKNTAMLVTLAFSSKHSAFGTDGMDDASSPSEADVWEAIEAANIARVTKDNHRRRLRFLINEMYNRRTKAPLLHLLGHPAYALKSIERHSQDPHTRVWGHMSPQFSLHSSGAHG